MYNIVLMNNLKKNQWNFLSDIDNIPNKYILIPRYIIRIKL